MPNKNDQYKIKRIIQLFAGFIALAIAIIIPGEQLYIGHIFHSEDVKSRAHYIANDLSEFIFLNSDNWSFQEHRYSGIIEKYIIPVKEQLILRDERNDIIFKTTDKEVEAPSLKVKEVLYDANAVAGSIEINSTNKELLMDAITRGIFGIIIGFFVYLFLYIFPTRTLSAAFEQLELATHSLKSEIENKEIALQEASILGQKLHKQAMHDSLTGLPNRSLYQERLGQAIANAQRKNNKLSVVMMDLNRFKEINDSLGHYAGDILLKEIAARLKSSLRDTDTVARFGGDEFAFIFHTNSPDSTEKLCRKISKIIMEPIVLDSHNIQITTSGSFGIACYPEHSHKAEELLQKADVAMYVAKKSPFNIEIYDIEFDKNKLERLRLLNYMNQAIIYNEFYLVYQPKLEINNLKVVGVEALIRWNNPDEGIISPALFIPIAEETEIIHPLTHWIIDTALEEHQKWKKAGIDLQLSINISANNLRDHNLHNKIAQLIQKWDTNPADVIFEVTESAMIDNPEQAYTILQEISNQGVRLSIDDFGTGHASLVQLKAFPFDELKIDQSFIKDIIVDVNDASIVKSAISLAKSLDMTTVAEGIEDERIIDLLKDMGCDLAQGFYLCKPLRSDELIQWIESKLSER